MTAVQNKCTAVTVVCRAQRKQSPFGIKTKNLQLEAIKEHESSKNHLHTMSCKLLKTALPEESAAVKALTSMKAAPLERMKLLFWNIVSCMFCVLFKK